MNNENSCIYCDKDERLTDLMLEICKLNVSTLYLFKEQTYKGRCVVAYNGHINELYELDEKQIELFMKGVAKVASTLNKTFSPNKINYGAYSDKLPHLHFHIVPKYEGGHTWGSTFEMMPTEKTILSDDEYSKMIELIKVNIIA